HRGRARFAQHARRATTDDAGEPARRGISRLRNWRADHPRPRGAEDDRAFGHAATACQSSRLWAGNRRQRSAQRRPEVGASERKIVLDAYRNADLTPYPPSPKGKGGTGREEIFAFCFPLQKGEGSAARSRPPIFLAILLI